MKTLPLWGELKSDLDSLGVSLVFVVSVPEDVRFHTFLLDGDNVIRLVGDPRGNEKLWKLYLGEIERLKLEEKTTADQ